MNDQVAMINQPQRHQKQHQFMNMSQNSMIMNQINPQTQPQMIQTTCSYGTWGQPQHFSKSKPDAVRPPQSTFNKLLGPKGNWKGKKVNTKPNAKRRMGQLKSIMLGSETGGVNIISGGDVSGGGQFDFNGYNPPRLNELQHQNRLKIRKDFPKKKFNKNNSMNMNMSGNNGMSAPFAPRNTTSFIIRAKKSGGIAPLVSPFPVTPAVLPTPTFSPSKEVLVDMATEEWGVDGYGSMNGLIRLRSPGHEMEAHEDDEEDGSSESDVEEHVEVEKRLDQDLSRFEMIYDPNINAGGMKHQNVLEHRVDDQDAHIAQLEEENLILKERLFLMERELGDLRRRIWCLERGGKRGLEVDEEVVENELENENESHGEVVRLSDGNNEYLNAEQIQGNRNVRGNVINVKGDVENDDTGLNTDFENNSIYVGRKEENNCDSDGLMKPNKPVQNIKYTDDNNDKESGVDVEVNMKCNVPVEVNEQLTVEEDACMLDDTVAEKDDAN